MRICVIGTGYVGLVTGACLAEVGIEVSCVDRDTAKIGSLINGEIPIYEPSLDEVVAAASAAGRLNFGTSLAAGIVGAEICMIAVGTPSREDGSADLRYVEEVARELGRLLTQPTVVVTKSTVPVGTGDRVQSWISEELERRRLNFKVAVVSNPEFLREGDAVNDFRKPDRIVIGTRLEDAAARATMDTLYQSFCECTKILHVGLRDAEMIKYAANAMLATRISFMNEVANICERIGVDVELVRQGIGSDPRIGPSFILPGAGYGGSCFPKDVRALIAAARECDFQPILLAAVDERNERQKHRLAERMREELGSLAGLKVALWGLAFKPGTDDMREAPAIALIQDLLEAGAKVIAHDPVAMDNARSVLSPAWLAGGGLRLAADAYAAIEGADVLVLVTEWKEYREADLNRVKTSLRRPIVFDGRNQFDPVRMRAAGFRYLGIGRQS